MAGTIPCMRPHSTPMGSQPSQPSQATAPPTRTRSAGLVWINSRVGREMGALCYNVCIYQLPTMKVLHEGRHNRLCSLCRHLPT